MRDHKLSALGNLLGGTLSRYGISERVIAAQIVASANQQLSQLLTPDQLQDVQAVSYKDSELLLVCKTPTARYAAEGLTKVLGRSLEGKYPDHTFRRIACVFKTFKANDDEWYNNDSV